MSIAPYELFNIRAATAVAMALATTTLASLGSNVASAGLEKKLLTTSKGGIGPIGRILPCQTKLDYPPNQVGGLYVTNMTGNTIPQQSKLTTVLKIGDKSYPQTKMMLGNWAPGQKVLARTFIWNPNAAISCTASIP